MMSEKTELVVVGVDGSTNSDAAVTWAQQYAKVTGGSLRVVTAWEWPISFGYPIGYDGWNPDADARKIAEKAVAGLDLPADRVEIATVEGYAGPALVRASEDADLLVVGSHGHRVIATVLLGSASAHCVHYSKIPVVVVR